MKVFSSGGTVLLWEWVYKCSHVFRSLKYVVLPFGYMCTMSLWMKSSVTGHVWSISGVILKIVSSNTVQHAPYLTRHLLEYEVTSTATAVGHLYTVGVHAGDGWPENPYKELVVLIITMKYCSTVGIGLALYLLVQLRPTNLAFTYLYLQM